MDAKPQFDLMVVGAGAAGLMCAIEAGRRGRRVVVLDHAAEPGRKILISGGGRANFTNLHARPENFVSANPHFAKSALARFTPRDFVALVEKHAIPYHEKKDGQLFCDRSARDIVGLLTAECAAAAVRLVLNAQVREVRHAGRFAAATSQGVFSAPALVVATGGLSIPKVGASDWGYRMARQFGHRIVECRPALTPLLFSNDDQRRFDRMAGVAAEAVVRCGKRAFRERLLFTHRGLSGPAVLQVSSYWQRGESIAIDLTTGTDPVPAWLERKRSGDRTLVKNAAAEFLPARLAERWFELRGGSRPLAASSEKELREIAESLARWTVTPAALEGFDKAEVTAGGVDTRELSSQTLESKLQPGLYFVGEVVDVTGQLGGFNFQWAWASGAAAGRAV